MFDSQSLSHLLLVSKGRCEKVLAYSVHLALDERIDLQIARLLLSHQAKHIPICLQSAGRTHGILSTGEYPVKEDVEDVDRNLLESRKRVFHTEFAVSARRPSDLVSPLVGRREDLLTRTKGS